MGPLLSLRSSSSRGCFSKEGICQRILSSLKGTFRSDDGLLRLPLLAGLGGLLARRGLRLRS